LIELVAIAMHEVGALLFQLGLRMHQGNIESIEQWNEKPPGARWELTPPKPTLFNHHAYLDGDVYPRGVADIVGYWAENRILGGVTVFDRQAEAMNPQFPPNVYFHSCRRRVTYRYYQLRDEQQQALLAYLLAENPDPSKSPLPIVADNRNLVRVDEERAIQQHLYRDIWERKPPTREYLDGLRGTVRKVVDYPEYAAYIQHINATFDTTSVGMPGAGRQDTTAGETNNRKGGEDGTTRLK
jgi:hypothetical protein